MSGWKRAQGREDLQELEERLSNNGSAVTDAITDCQKMTKVCYACVCKGVCMYCIHTSFLRDPQPLGQDPKQYMMVYSHSYRNLLDFLGHRTHANVSLQDLQMHEYLTYILKRWKKCFCIDYYSIPAFCLSISSLIHYFSSSLSSVADFSS